MTLEAWLAYGHIVAILSLAVFQGSLAALCRAEWLNAAVVHRLVRLDRIAWAGMLAVLVSGLLRASLGMKGAAWYWGQPLLHLKLALFTAMLLLAVPGTRRFLRWRRQVQAGGGLPAAEEISAQRRWLMWQSHLMVVLPLAASFLAR